MTNSSAFVLDGMDPPVLLWHAAGFSSLCYKPLARSLGHRTIGFDLPGHGSNPSDLPESRSLDWNVFFDSAKQAITSFGEPFFMFGHSLGGVVAMRASTSTGCRPLGLILYEPVLIDPAIEPLAAATSQLVERTLKRKREFATLEIARENFGSKLPFSAFDAEVLDAYLSSCLTAAGDCYRLRMDPNIEAAIYRGGLNHKTLEILESLVYPTLLLVGEKSDKYTKSTLESAAARMKDCQVLEVTGCGHFGPFENPSTVGSICQGFMELHTIER